jgi:hypothetical protein
VTIILSLVSVHYALQVSDRLLTVKAGNRYEPWDPVSNKSVIMLTRDGLISMGYSGPTHISGAATDGWIAEVLAGEDLGADQVRPKFVLHAGSAGPKGFLAPLLTTVADRLNRAVSSGGVTNNLSIYYVGLRWQSLRKQAWPVFGRITWEPTRGGYTMAMSPRRWRWESGRNYLFRASGRSEKVAQRLLRNRLSSTDLQSKEQTSAALIDVLRSLPPQDPTVGKDCLVTTIQRISPHVHIKYAPYDIRQIMVAFTGRTVTVTAAFTPWIVTPGLLAFPQAIAGEGFTYHSRGFEITVEGPKPGGDLAIMSSQLRRRP